MQENIGNSKKEMMLIESDINLLLTDADKAEDKAEELKSFPYITKANALYRRTKDKRKRMN